jgi:hypothetical protein
MELKRKIRKKIKKSKTAIEIGKNNEIYIN